MEWITMMTLKREEHLYGCISDYSVYITKTLENWTKLPGIYYSLWELQWIKCEQLQSYIHAGSVHICLHKKKDLPFLFYLFLYTNGTIENFDESCLSLIYSVIYFTMRCLLHFFLCLKYAWSLKLQE